MSAESRVVRFRSKVDSALLPCDMDAIIKDLDWVSSGGFAIFKSATLATLSVFIEIMTSRSSFLEAWASRSSAILFTRPVLCDSRIVLSSILGNDEYQGARMFFSKKAPPLPCVANFSTPSISTASLQRSASVQSTPPNKSEKRSPKKLNFSRKLSFRSIKPKKFVLPEPLPPLSPCAFPPPPFYYSGYVEFTGNGNWKVNFSKFFEEIVVPEEDAYSCYMTWVESAHKMRCGLFEFNASEIGEEMYFEVCDHADCHEYAKFPCVGCESPVCKCHELVLDNSWKAKIKRAVMMDDAEEVQRCKLNYDLGVRNDPDVLYRDRVQMLKHSNYQTHLAQFTSDQKVERCNAFCQRMFSAPGSSSCTTLSELRKNLWRPLRHSSFFLKKLFNPYTFAQTKIDF